MSAIAKINPERTYNNRADAIIRITAKDYSDTFDVNYKLAYRDLKRAAEHLFERQLSYTTVIDGKERIHRFRWVGSATYSPGEGFVELEFTQKVLPHLTQLCGVYTSYKLKNAASFKSVYSWRLYELGRSWLEHCNNGRSVVITLDNYRAQLSISDGYRWDQVKSRCISAPIEEIKKHSSMRIKWATIKKGRSVHSIKFFFHEVEDLPQKNKSTSPKLKITSSNIDDVLNDTTWAESMDDVI